MEILEAERWNPARQCTATNRQGERCRRQPIPGGTVCVMHGGRLPQTVAAAKRRLLEAVEPAISRLLTYIDSPPGLCGVCGRSDDTGAIVRAAQVVLDRAGLHPSLTVEVQPAAVNPLEGLTTDELIHRLEDMLRMARDVGEKERTLRAADDQSRRELM